MILVTGGAGYIGSHTVKALRQAGMDPVIFDDFSTGHREFADGVPCVEGDLRRPGDLATALTRFPVDAVLHFAGKAYVGESYADPLSYYDTNVTGGLNLLRAMKNAGVTDIVFSSTCATYGNPQSLPLREDHPQKPINPYGETKLAFERLLDWSSTAHGLRFAALRYFNAAGADPDGEFGEDHEPETHLIPLALMAAAGVRADIRVFGTDYPTADGTCLRDYIHVTDLAAAHVVALQALRTGALQNVALNLGTGTAHSVREVIGAVEHVTGLRVPVVEEGRRAGDPAILVADPSEARRRLNWTPVRSDLASIVQTAWVWHQKRWRR